MCRPGTWHLSALGKNTKSRAGRGHLPLSYPDCRWLLILIVALQLGQDPESGQNVYVKNGRFGYFAQLGERKRNGPRVKIVGLPEGLDPDDVDLERALELLGQFEVRNLGPHPDTGAIVTVQTKGRFGPFVSCRREHATVPERFDPMDVTLEDAVRFLEARRELMDWRRDTRIAFVKIADLPDADRESLVDRMEVTRARQAHLPEDAHRRGDISDEALERAMEFLDERLEEVRRAAATDATSETIA